MPNTATLLINYPTENQAQKASTVALGLEQLAKAAAFKFSEASTGIAAAGTLTLEFDESTSLSDRGCLHSAYIEVTSGASGNFTVEHPDYAHRFLFENNSGHTITLQCVTPGDALIVEDGELIEVYCDGTDMLQIQKQVAVKAAGGSYERRMNGVQECWVANFTCNGSVTWNFPKDFVATDTLAIQVHARSGEVITEITAVAVGSVSIATSDGDPDSGTLGDSVNTTIDIFAKGFYL